MGWVARLVGAYLCPHQVIQAAEVGAGRGGDEGMAMCRCRLWLRGRWRRRRVHRKARGKRLMIRRRWEAEWMRSCLLGGRRRRTMMEGFCTIGLCRICKGFSLWRRTVTVQGGNPGAEKEVGMGAEAAAGMAAGAGAGEECGRPAL